MTKLRLSKIFIIVASAVLSMVLLLGCVDRPTSTPDDTTSSYVWVEDPPIYQEGMTLMFRDEFSGTRINPDNWDFQIGMGSQGPVNPWGNRELQFYRRENAEVRDGNLIINGRRQNIIFRWHGNGNAEELYATHLPLDQINFNAIPRLEGTTPADVTVLTSGASAGFSNQVGRLYMAEFSSVRMRTHDRFSQMFGRFEARISLPDYTAMWPAFWMMPERNTITGGGWPRNGEIDIMEARGRDPYHVTQTVHIGAGTNARHRWLGRRPDYRLPEGTTIRDFIEYRIDWHPDRMEWFVDGVSVFTLQAYTWRNPPGAGFGGTTNENPGTSAGWGGVWYNPETNPNLNVGTNTAHLLRPDRLGAPFDHPFHMILNLAIGGVYDGHRRPLDENEYNVHGELVESRFEHAELKVDWVRVWQFDEYLEWYFCFDTNTPMMGE